MNKTRYTVADGKRWAEERTAELIVSYHRSGIPQNEVMWELWQAGCFVSAMLEEHGATREQRNDIGFVHGQRSFGRDMWDAGIALLNEFVETGDVGDKPGVELADRLIKEILQ